MIRVIAAAAAIFLAVSGCGDGGDGPTDPGGETTIASVELAPGDTTFVSLGESAVLDATALDASGDAVSATFEWSSTDSAAVDIDDSGRATAVANGSSTIRASAGGVSGSATVVVAQTMDSLEVAQGDEQAGGVGMPLDTLVQVRAYDPGGSPAAGITLAFAASGGGSVDAETATTDADGIASVEWTLGTEPGPFELTVTPEGNDNTLLVVSATGLAVMPATMELLDGDEQSELVGEAVPAPIRVLLLDEYDNPVVGVPVEFSVTGGGGTVEPEEAMTDLDGVASATWTLGTGTGEQTARALVRDSAVLDLVDLPGSPVDFTAVAVDFALDAVTPEQAAVGGTITVEGTGFGPDAADNEVRIDGEVATIVETTQTSITVEVPPFGCAAARPREVEVTRGSNSAAVEVDVDPAGVLDLAVGERVVVTDPEDYCLQFAATADGSSDYLVGLTSTRAWNGSAAFEVTGNDPSTDDIVAAGDGSTTAGYTATGLSSGGGELTSPASGTGHPAGSEAALREWERTFLASSPEMATTTSSSDGSIRTADISVAATPPVESDVTFRVPDIVVDPCNEYVAQAATVVHNDGLVVAVPQIPQLAKSTIINNVDFQAALAALRARFATISDQVADYTGELSLDADEDGLVTVLLTPALNDGDVPRAFATAVDLVDRSVCPASDEQAIVYVTIPDVDYSQPLVALAELRAAMADAPPHLSHELTHVAQNVTRIGEGIATPLPGWLAEGQAELLVEVVGRELRGDEGRMDYGADVVNADALATDWYLPRFERLSYLFGWDGASGRVDGAPEQCSLFGFGGLDSTCEPEATPGAAWSLVRYLTDRIAAGLTDGEPELHRALTLLTDADAIDNVLETYTGSDLAALIVDWAMMLYADGRLSAGEAPELQLGSWNLADIYGSMSVERRLEPDAFTLEAFTRSGSVVGGGTAYLRFTAADGHGALAVRVRDALERALSPELETRLWVIRLP